MKRRAEKATGPLKSLAVVEVDEPADSGAVAPASVMPPTAVTADAAYRGDSAGVAQQLPAFRRVGHPGSLSFADDDVAEEHRTGRSRA